MRTALRRLTSLAAVGALAAAGLVLTAGVAHADPIAYAIAGNPHPDDRDVCQFGTVDLATGAFAPVGAPSVDLCVFDLTVAPDGTVYGILLDPEAPGDTPWFLQTIDPATGAVTASQGIGPGGSTDGGEGGGVAYTAGGQLYVEYVPATEMSLDPCIGGLAYCLATLDAANPGTTDIIGPAPNITIVESLSISCAGDFVVTQEAFDGLAPDATEWPDVGADVLLDANLARVSPTDGSTDIVGPYGQVITGHDFDDAGTLWGVGFVVGGPPSVFTIDTESGTATSTATISAQEGLYAIAIPHCVAAPPTPEAVVIEPTFTG